MGYVQAGKEGGGSQCLSGLLVGVRLGVGEVFPQVQKITSQA